MTKICSADFPPLWLSGICGCSAGRPSWMWSTTSGSAFGKRRSAATVPKAATVARTATTTKTFLLVFYVFG